jgi:hypothetical protein
MRWLPVDAALGKETLATVDTALAALAAYARRLRFWNHLTIALATATVVAPMSVGAEPPRSLMLAGVAVVLLRAARTGAIWLGRPGLLTAFARPLPRPALPPTAAELLASLRQSRRRMRIKWSEDRDWSDISTDSIARPFGALLLSSDPDVQALALFSWRLGATPAIEVQHDDVGAKTDFPAWADRCLSLSSAALADALRQLLDNLDASSPNLLKFDAMMTANALLRSGIAHHSPKVLIDATCDFLLAPDGQPLLLNPAAYGRKSPEPIVLGYRRNQSKPHGPNLGLRGTTSVTWMQQAFTGRYPGFSEELARIAFPDEA